MTEADIPAQVFEQVLLNGKYHGDLGTRVGSIRAGQSMCAQDRPSETVVAAEPCKTCGGVSRHVLGCWRVDDRGDLLPIKERLVEWAHSSACKGQGFGGHRWGRLDYTLLEAARGKAADDKAIETLLEALGKQREALEAARSLLIYFWNNYELDEDTGDVDEVITQVESALGRPGRRSTESQPSTSGQTQTGTPPTVVNGEGKSE